MCAPVSDAREAATGAGGNLTNHPGLGGNAWAPLDVDGVKIACSELARLPLDVATKSVAYPVRLTDFTGLPLHSDGHSRNGKK